MIGVWWYSECSLGGGVVVEVTDVRIMSKVIESARFRCLAGSGCHLR